MTATIDRLVYIQYLILILGITNFLAILAVLFSCRSFIKVISFFTGKDPLQNKIYRSYYKYHGIYWGIFWFSVLLHVMVALTHTKF
jgi:hypothetical protein